MYYGVLLTVHCCVLLCTKMYHCVLLCTIVHHGVLLCTNVYNYALLLTIVYDREHKAVQEVNGSNAVCCVFPPLGSAQDLRKSCARRRSNFEAVPTPPPLHKPIL